MGLGGSFVACDSPVIAVNRFSSRKDELEPFYKLRKIDSVTFDLSGTGKSSGDITILLNVLRLVD